MISGGCERIWAVMGKLAFLSNRVFRGFLQVDIFGMLMKMRLYTWVIFDQRPIIKHTVNFLPIFRFRLSAIMSG